MKDKMEGREGREERGDRRETMARSEVKQEASQSLLLPPCD